MEIYCGIVQEATFLQKSPVAALGELGNSKHTVPAREMLRG